jgi:hypothetical protein
LQIESLFLRFFKDDPLYEGNLPVLERHSKEFADLFKGCPNYSMAELQGGRALARRSTVVPAVMAAWAVQAT